jgi:hypothetical protein
MQRVKNFGPRLFYFLGERLAFLLVIFVFTALFFIDTHPAFSEEEEVFTGYTKDGLTYDYYLSSSFSYSVEQLEVIVTSHVEENEFSNFIYVEPVSVSDNEIWEQLASCESKGNWSINTGNGYYGGLQFSEGAWVSVGGVGFAHEHSRDEQIMRGKMLQEKRGWAVWGLCAKKLGLN